MDPPTPRLLTAALEHLRDLNTLFVGARAEELAQIVPVLAATLAHATARLAEERGSPEEDRWLAPKEAAAMLGTSVRSLNRRWRTLPFCRPGITRGFRVSLTGLREYMAHPPKRNDERARNRTHLPRHVDRTGSG